MRQWVESEPCEQLELCFGIFPLPPVSTLAPLSMAPSLQTELRLDSITVLLQYGALARAPALFSLSLEPQPCSQKCCLGGGWRLGRGWGLELSP